MLNQLNTSFYNFISESSFFDVDPLKSQDEATGETSDDDNDSYFEEIEMSSYLRAYKELSASDTLF